MTAHLVTFSDESMSRSRELCVRSAQNVGLVNDWIAWTRDDLLHSEIYAANKALFDAPRGLGFWAWKPLIILMAMRSLITQRQFLENSIGKVVDGDVVIYADAGIEFIAPVSHIIDRMGHDKPQDDIWLFGNNWDHAHWCKRDVIDAIYREHDRPWKLLSPWSYFGQQCQASVIFLRVSDDSRQFVAEWLKWCLFEGGRLIDDSPSTLPNHPEFREHRHDQAILTTLAYREGIKLHYWPAMYNDGAFSYEKLPCYAGDDYPILFHHHRRRDHEWPAQIGARYVGMTLNGERYKL